MGTMAKVWMRTAFVAVIAVVISMFGMGGALAEDPVAPPAPTLTSDLADYPPGATVTLAGAGFAADDTVVVKVNDDAGQTWALTSGVNGAPASPVADAAGSFTYVFTLPTWFVATYTANATGSDGRTATTTFTDAAVAIDQCANDKGVGYAGSTCQWVNGNLNQNNSVYNEGDATVQRVLFTGLTPGSSYTYTIGYDATKGGLHAYDFLTSWNYSENWVTNLCAGATAGCSTANVSTTPILYDNSVAGIAPTGQVFTMSGGTLTGSTAPTYTTSGGDQKATVTVTFTVGADGNAVLWFGAHVASQLDWGVGNGAGSISGSPYHVYATAMWNNTANSSVNVGNQDNQMASGAAQKPGTLTIIKDAVPNDPQDFNFTLTRGATGDTTPIVLDDDPASALSNTWTYPVAPGTWTITEASLDGWSLTGLDCTVTGTDSSWSKSGATATLNVVSGGTTTCTYTNTKTIYQNLTVDTTASGAFNRDYDWTISKTAPTELFTTGTGTATANYTVTATPSAAQDSGWTVTGTVSATNPNVAPTAVAYSGVTLGVTAAGGVCTVANPNQATIAAGATASSTYTCTFTAAPTTVAVTGSANWTTGNPYGTTSPATDATPASVDFGAVTPTTTDASVHVHDTLSTGTVGVDPDLSDETQHLFTASVSDPASQTHSYSETLNGTAGTCTDYTNKATVADQADGDGVDTASAATKVCAGANLTVAKTAAASYGAHYNWTITKTASDPGTIPMGSTATVTYTVTVTPAGVTYDTWLMSGVITVTNPNTWQDVVVTDVTDVVDMGPGVTCTPVGGSRTVLRNASLEIPYTCTFADGASPKVTGGTNQATITWDAAAAHTTAGSAQTSSVTVSYTQSNATSDNSTITVTDPAAEGGVLGTATWADGAKTFTYHKPINVTPGQCTTVDNTATIRGTTLSASASATLCVTKPLTVAKSATATYDTRYDWSIDKAVSADQNLAAGATATFDYTVTVTAGSATNEYQPMTGTITVTNPNTFLDVTVDLTDSLTGISGLDCTITDPTGVVVPKSGSASRGYTCTGTPSALSGTNTATATWDAAAAAKLGAPSATGTVAVNYQLVNQIDKTIRVIDDKTVPGTATVLDDELIWPGAGVATEYEYSLTRTAPSGSCESVTNTATIDLPTGTDQSASTTSKLCGLAAAGAEKTAVATFDRDYDWTVAKSAPTGRQYTDAQGNLVVEYTVTPTATGPVDSGFMMSGQVTVTNPNTWTAIDATVTDVPGITGDCTILYPGGGNSVSIAAGGSAQVTYTCSFAAVGADQLTGTNTATVTASAGGVSQTSTATKPFTFVARNVTDASITLSDPMAPNGSLGTVDVAASGQPITYSATISNPTPGTCKIVPNTVTGTLSGGSEVEASANVEVCRGADLTISKSAAGKLDRLYNWKIAKDVDNSKVTVAEDGTVTSKYTITVTPDGSSDSNKALTGQVVVNNPNPWDVTATVTDVIDNGGTCTFAGDTDNVTETTVPAGGSSTLTYSCTFPDGALVTGNNNASVTWDKDAAHTPSNSATAAAASYNLEASQTPTNYTVTVSDLQAPAGTFTPVTWNAAGTPTKFEYKVVRTATPGQCDSYPNTATLSTKQTAGASVEICGVTKPTLDKTVIASYETTYDWSIKKRVVTDPKSGAAGTTLTYVYAVDATPVGTGTDHSWTMSGTISVKNPNGFGDPITYTVGDAFPGGTCTIAGQQTGTVTVAAGQTETLDYSCSFATKPNYTGDSNKVTATWGGAGGGTASKNVPVTFEQGVKHNWEVPVFDNMTVTGAAPTKVDIATWDAAHTTQSFPVTVTQTAPSGTCTTWTNRAWLDLEVGTDPSDSVDVTGCGLETPSLSKTAETSMARDYDWTLTKSLVEDQSDSTTDGSTPATLTYTVTATHTAEQDGAFVMTGNLTFANSNDWTGMDVTVNDIPGSIAGAVCTYIKDGVEGAEVSVPASGSITVGYRCTFPLDVPAAQFEGVNSATADWVATDARATDAASGKETATADYAFVPTAGQTDSTLTVVDTFNGGTPTTLGTATLDGANTWTVVQTVPGVAGTCTTYTNVVNGDETVGEDPTASADASVCRGADLWVTKTASATSVATHHWTITKTGPANPVNVLQAATPTDTVATVPYTITVGKDLSQGVGGITYAWTLTGTITAHNPNTFMDVTVTVSDELGITGATCAIQQADGTFAATGTLAVPAGGTASADYSCTLPTNVTPAQVTDNTATIAWDAARGLAAGSDSDTIAVAKAVGTPVNASVTVNDPKVVGQTWTVNWTDPLPATISTSVTYTAAELTMGGCATVDNTATLSSGQSATGTGKVCVLTPPTAAKVGTATFERDYNWSLDKKVNGQDNATVNDAGEVDASYIVTATPTGPIDTAYVMEGTVTVTNPNWAPITATVTDLPGFAGATCTYTGNGVTIAAGESAEVGYRCTFTAVPNANLSGTNTAKVSYTGPGGSGTMTAMQSYTFAPRKVTDRFLTVTDVFNGGAATTLGTADAESGVWTSASYEQSLLGVVGDCVTYPNTATGTSTATNGSVVKDGTVSDTASVKLCRGADLTVTKTATTSFTRTYNWTLLKKMTGQAQYGPTLASTVTVPYSVAVTATAKDSAFTITGTITVSNSNTWQDVSTKVSDTLTMTGMTCVVKQGATAITPTTPVTVPKSGSTVLTYSCTGTPSSYDGKNIATVTWEQDAASTPHASASGDAAVKFANPTLVGATNTVTDNFNAGGAVKLADLNAATGAATNVGLGAAMTKTGDGATATTWTFTYTRSVAVPTNGCKAYANTATVGSATSTATVTVCGPPWLGDGTIGFWQNPNGQGIIKGGAYTSTLVGTKYVNVCNVAKWLTTQTFVINGVTYTGLQPFASDSTIKTMTCAQFATYVYNTVKAANASGATMEAMLKAQMLAAALNYYYTSIEKKRAGSDLSTLTFDVSPWSGGFGGATSMTLLQMLQYASSQYNTATKAWYGANKTVQGYAKDAFQAINMSRILVL